MLVYVQTKHPSNVLAYKFYILSTLKLFLLCAFSVFCRQTNILWLALIAFENLYNSCHKVRDLVHNKFQFELQNVKTLVVQVLRSSTAFILTAVGFVAFVILNDFNIVVGDKSAHQPAFHAVQICYCFLFILVWNLPTLVLDFGAFSKILRSLGPVGTVFLLS